MMNPANEQLLFKVLQKAKKEKLFPGCVVGIITKNLKIVYPFGHLTYEKDSFLVKRDTVYDVASITKSIPISSLALKLLDEKKVSLETRIKEFIPELRNGFEDKITLWHLLTQTLDFPFFLSSYKDKTSEEIRTIIMTTPLKTNPGTRYVYSNATSILLGLFIEHVCKKPLDVLADEYFFKPLGMMRTTFHPKKMNKDEIAPTEFDTWRKKLLHGEVHDEITYVLQKERVVGSSGLFSTVPDLLEFVKMLLRNGTVNKKKYFSKKTIEQIYENQGEQINESIGLGWEMNQRWYMGDKISYKAIGKTGFTGCHIVIDPEKQTGLVLLSNHIYPLRPTSKDRLNQFRREVANIVFS